jgi:hypothetical protein
MSGEWVRGVAGLAWTTWQAASARGVKSVEVADTTEDVLNREQHCS